MFSMVTTSDDGMWNVAGSRTALYVPSAAPFDNPSGVVEVSVAAAAAAVVTQQPRPELSIRSPKTVFRCASQPPPPSSSSIQQQQSSSTAETHHRMRRPPAKKAEEMSDRSTARRPPPYRPKSRTDSSSGIGGSAGGRLRGDGGGGSSDEDLARQNTDLRQRLQDEASLYRKRLDTYRQAQQNQAALVSRLQAKVLQYKQRCADLEAQMTDTSVPYVDTSTTLATPRRPNLSLSAAPSSALEQAQQHLKEIHEERITDLDVALRKLDEERNRCEKLIQQNRTMRDQLEESHQTNEELTGDLQKLTNQFEELREEMLIKEDEWKDEEQAFNDYYSTEHNRLLNLWRDVVSVKRLFMDVQSSTERDLTKLKTEIGGFGRDMTYACGRMDKNFAESLNSMIERPSFNLENVELKARMDSLSNQIGTQQQELKGKEEKIQQLLREVQNLEERCSEAEHNVGQVMRLQDEVELLQNALRDIAHALIQDAETKDVVDLSQPTHIHLSASTPIPQKSPKRGRNLPHSSAAFAESTISAVQAALHKYQSFIHELQVKLQSNREQFLLVRKQCEHSEETVSTLEDRVKELVALLDSSKAQCSQLLQERESLQKNLDSVKAEKLALDRHRIEINGMVDSLNGDYDNLQKSYGKLQKEVDVLSDEKIFLQSEIDRLNQEANLREMNLRSEEDRCSRIREELLTTREELNKLYLAHDMLEQQKFEADNVISSMEKSKAGDEMELRRMLEENSGGRDSLAKCEAQMANLERDRSKLQELLKKMEEEKAALQAQCSDQQGDIQSLRKELLQAEQSKLDIESDKVSLGEKAKFLEIEKDKIEMELGQVVRERGDLSNQLTVLGRKRDTLNEELVRTKQKLEQATETNQRINRNLEELVNECEEKQANIETLDKEVQRVQELLAGVRSEKESLEAILFESQTNLEASDDKRQQLEQEQQELLVQQEALKGQVTRLNKDLERSEKRCAEIKNSLSQQAGNQEAEFQHIVTNLKKQSEETISKLSEERDRIRTSLEQRSQQAIHQLTKEKDEEIQQLLDRIDNLQSHIENVCQQHEELMLRAENDKQQALLIAHHDQQALHDRLEAARKELEAERSSLERMRRESNSRFDQDRNSINQLKEELTKQKAKLEETRGKFEEERARLEQKVVEILGERESAQGEVENLKMQLHLCEDKIDALNSQLHETVRKLRECENNSEGLRKDLTDVRRQLTDSNFEKEKYHGSNKEMREVIKKVESEKRDMGRQLEESFQKIAALEDLKQSLESERTRLQNVVKEVEKEQLQTEHKLQSLHDELQRTQSSNAQQQNEEKELQTRLLNEVEERERAHQEVHTLKKQISELDRNLDQTRQELGRTRSHSAHLEEQWHAREQDLLVHLEDCRGREKRLEDQKHNLEVCLVDATQQIQELKAKLGGAESRVRSLDNQLTQTETAKRDVEQKLASVVSTLRRIAGIQIDGTVNHSSRLLSPSRRWSPARTAAAASHEVDNVTDIDPEVVRKGVRNLMQQVAQIERERDDFKTQVGAVKKQLKESNDNQNKGDSKLTKVLQNLRSLQDEKGTLETKLGQKTIALNSQTDALHKKSEEVQQLRDKITNLELSVSSCKEEKMQFEDKVEKYKNALGKLDAEKRALQEELGRTENRSSKLELQRMSAEGDLQRLQMMLQEKDVQIQKLQEKCETQSRNLVSLEERCISLKTTIDQLNSSLERAAGTESEMKVEIQSLQRSLLETTTATHTGAEKLKHLHKSLASSENERKILSERFEASQLNLNEFRRNNQILQDQVTRLNNELANNEVIKSGLESQLRLAQWPETSTPSTHHHHQHEDELIRQLQRDRSELRSKVETLTVKMRQVESENRDLERTVTKCRSKSFERPEKYEMDARVSDRDSIKFEQENAELRMKITKLEMEVGDKEAELARLRNLHVKPGSYESTFERSEVERYRAAQLQAERLLEAREQSHRQQVARLENQVTMLREQLNQEIKRRQQYILRSSRAGREMQHLRQALGESLRTVSQDPSLDALLLEQEARKLDNTATNTASLPPALNLTYDRKSVGTPQPPNY